MSIPIRMMTNESIIEMLRSLGSHQEIGAQLDHLARQGYSIEHKIHITLPDKNFDPLTARTHWIVEEPDLEASLEVGRQRLIASLADLCDDPRVEESTEQ